MNSNLPETVYTSDSKLSSPEKLLKKMLADLRMSRFLAWRLFVRNMAAQHRQTVLGYLWLLLGPVAQTLLWVFLNSQKVINVGTTDIPYPVFVLTGTLLWSGFTDSILQPIQQIQASKQMLTKIHFPHEAILLASFGQILVNFGIRLLLLIIVFTWFRLPMTVSLLFAPLGILALVGLGMMIGLLLTPLAMLYGDIQRLLGLAISLWFFVTPVIYPIPKSGWAALMTKLNPVAPLLVSTRQWLTGGALTQLVPFITVTVATIALSLLAWIIYRLAVPYLIERIGS